MSYKVELHCHSTASDGKLSPSELMALAYKNKLKLLALTDHDTTQGVEEAVERGNLLGIKVLPGIELSTIYNNESIHLLGYFKDESFKDKGFQNFLQELKDYRVHRAKKIINNIDIFFNIKLNYEGVLKAANGVIARPHIAKAIIDAGYPYSWEYIFHNIIGKDSPAYVHNKKIQVKEGIELLRSVNALVILAHPVLIKNTPFEEIASLGFDGIEAIYFQNTPKDTEHFINYAKSNNMLITGGSDFHGIGKGDSKHGSLGEISPDIEYINALLKKLSNH